MRPFPPVAPFSPRGIFRGSAGKSARPGAGSRCTREIMHCRAQGAAARLLPSLAARRHAMPYRPSVVCPVDFSEPSRAALSFAAAIADHFGARLTIVAVDDPLLTEVAEATGRVPSLSDESEHELRRFCDDTLEQTGP